MGGQGNAFRFLMEKCEVKRHLDDEGIGGKVILKRILKNRLEGMNWLNLAWDIDKWQAVVTTVMSLGFHKT